MTRKRDDGPRGRGGPPQRRDKSSRDKSPRDPARPRRDRPGAGPDEGPRERPDRPFAKGAKRPFGKKELGGRDGKPAFRKSGDRPRDGAPGPRPARPFRRREDERPRPAPQTPPAQDKPVREGDRIAKLMSRAGLCSRRDAERWIEEGRVAVNGVALASPNAVIGPGDRVTVDGKPLAGRERTRLFLFHKPRGLVTTDRDPEGRPTIFDALPPELPRLMTIGRLDINTEGLLLLTNDGGLARVLELPSTGWLRRYRVRAHGETDQAKLDGLAAGVSIEGVDYQGVEATLDRVQGSNVWITMGLREGKNREVKRILEHLGLSVNRLIRISYGPFQLGDLAEGAVEEVRTRVLRDQLGKALADEAGVDFDSPLIERDPAEAPVERRPPPRAPRETFEEAPRPERPKPGPRKHVSALRAERAEAPRMRTERGETEDRRGRAIVVERKMRAAPAAAPPDRAKGGKVRPPRRDRDAAPPRERPPRFGEARGDGPRPRRFERPAGGDRPRRFEGGEAPRRGRTERDVEDFRGPKPPRRDARRPQGGEGDRPRRFERPEGGERPRRFERPDGPRPPRRDGDRPRQGAGGGFKPRGDRPGRGPGDRPGGKPGGFRPGGGKPGGRPSGGRPGGGRPRPPRG